MKQTAEKTGAPEKSARPQRERKPKLSFKERRELESLEAELEALNREKSDLETLFASGEQVDDIAGKSARFSELSAIIDEKELRWLELSEKEA